jgi:hypothetical protein
MDAWVWLLIAAALVVVIALVAWSLLRKRRSEALRERFGPEYERTVAEAGGRRAAESELAARQDRREEMDIRPLAAATRERYATAWTEVQARFVDAPVQAVGEADQLVIAVMRERGYPVDDFDQRSADISVDYPQLVHDYRAAHAISLASRHDQASTEDLRQAMVHYRSLFDELLGGAEAAERATEDAPARGEMG